MEHFTATLYDALPKRSPGAQLLRDAALGHKEYPDDEETLRTVNGD